MTDEAHDMALAALLAVARDIAPGLPEILIRTVYSIESRHQFNRDRDVPLEEIRALIDDHAATLSPPVVKAGTAA